MVPVVAKRGLTAASGIYGRANTPYGVGAGLLALDAVQTSLFNQDLQNHIGLNKAS